MSENFAGLDINGSFVREIRTASSINSQLHHFQIVFDEGEINIIADHFKSSITDEFSHAGSSASQVNQTHLQNQSKDVAPSPELACTFCGKQQSEVAKIITGPNVNICDEWLCLKS